MQIQTIERHTSRTSGTGYVYTRQTSGRRVQLRDASDFTAEFDGERNERCMHCQLGTPHTQAAHDESVQEAAHLDSFWV